MTPQYSIYVGECGFTEKRRSGAPHDEAKGSRPCITAMASVPLQLLMLPHESNTENRFSRACKNNCQRPRNKFIFEVHTVMSTAFIAPTY